MSLDDYGEKVMIHLGDITKIKGAEVPMVDVVTGGSPCQDLSVAGKRAGMKHEDHGHDETTRSGLFMEQIRIIKEMREHDKLRFERMCDPKMGKGNTTNVTSGKAGIHNDRAVNIRPRFMVWENVPGAFISNKGEDFRAVLEETAKIADETAIIPEPPKRKWHNSGVILADGWSIAWRVFDAQFWGVPQGRRRIYLVADFGGHAAPEILFEREGLFGHITESRGEKEGTSADFERCITETSRYKSGIKTFSCSGFSDYQQSEKAATLRAETGDNQLNICIGTRRDAFCIDHVVTTGGSCTAQGPCFKQGQTFTLKASGIHAVMEHPKTLKIRSGCEGGGKGALIQDNLSATLSTQNDQTLFESKVYGIGGFDSGGMKSDNPHSGIYEAETTRTLDQNGGNPACNQGGMMIVDKPCSYQKTTGPLMANSHPGSYCGQDAYTDMFVANPAQSVRRLTPLECTRLQGYPDDWGDLAPYNPADADFWEAVRKAHAEINGKNYKPVKNIKKWYDKLRTDSAEYKAYGNSLAIPNAEYVMEGIALQGAETLGSLFDGIGGFPLAGTRHGITPLWASEVEPYPIAVTKSRFKGNMQEEEP